MELFSLKFPNYMIGVLKKRGCLLSYLAGVHVVEKAASGFRVQKLTQW